MFVGTFLCSLCFSCILENRICVLKDDVISKYIGGNIPCI